MLWFERFGLFVWSLWYNLKGLVCLYGHFSMPCVVWLEGLVCLYCMVILVCYVWCGIIGLVCLYGTSGWPWFGWFVLFLIK